MNKFNGVKVFTATQQPYRSTLGDEVTKWLGEHPTFEIADIVVTQSSDSAFHCVTITIWYLDPVMAARLLGVARRINFKDGR